jgi:Tol biopolymer transport system component
MKKPIRLICLLLAAMVCASFLVSCNKKSTRSCGGAELIAFISDRSGYQYMLYTMQSDGTEQKMLEGAWVMRMPGRLLLLSPDKSLIVFPQGNKSYGWLMKINPDGSGLDTLVMGATPSYVGLGDWSPDGSRLVYYLHWYMDPSQDGIYTINSDGSGKVRLDEGYDPRFCGNDKVVYSQHDGIYIIGTNGENKLRLQEALFGTSLLMPAGSPDGQKVAFCRGLVVPPPNQKCELEIINPDSSGQTKLTEMYGLSTISEIEFSPDSKRILFLAVKETSAEIYVVNVDGSGLRPLTNNSALADGHARWSPDGSRIVFTSTKDGNPEIYTVNTYGPPQMKRLTDNLADDCNPDW